MCSFNDTITGFFFNRDLLGRTGVNGERVVTSGAGGGSVGDEAVLIFICSGIGTGSFVGCVLALHGKLATGGDFFSFDVTTAVTDKDPFHSAAESFHHIEGIEGVDESAEGGFPSGVHNRFWGARGMFRGVLTPGKGP